MDKIVVCAEVKRPDTYKHIWPIALPGPLKWPVTAQCRVQLYESPWHVNIVHVLAECLLPVILFFSSFCNIKQLGNKLYGNAVDILL